MKTELKSLQLINFKGIKSLKIEFTEKTNIFGANATGKTTVFDAFTWLLFGKDSQDRKDYQIKTLDSQNNVIHKLEHEVEGVLDVDNRKIVLRRIYKEKWVKKRGTTEAELTGHETLFYVDEVLYQAKEYSEKINSIIDEELFRLITNAHYFNDMHWKKQRTLLLSIAGDLSNEDVARGKKEFEALFKFLDGRTMAEYRKMIKEKIKRLKDDLKDIPVRVDEITRSMPEAGDYEAIEKEISEKQKRVEEIENAMLDKTAEYDKLFKKQTAHLEKISGVKSQLAKFETDTQLELDKVSNKSDFKIKSLENQIENRKTFLGTYTKRKNAIKEEVEDINHSLKELRNDWHGINAEVLKFNEDEFSCPTCQRPFEESVIESKKEELTSNFNNDKIKRLDRLSKKGKGFNDKLEELEKELAQLEDDINEESQSINNAKADLHVLTNTPRAGVSLEFTLAKNREYLQIQEQLEKLEEKTFKDIKVDDEQLRSERTLIIGELDDLKLKLGAKANLNSIKNRILQLNKDAKKIAQQIADYEKIDFAIEGFIKVKIDALEENLNKIFKTVKFKLFEHQLNGGVNETCETLINGVPFSAANNAARINSGIEIINVLCKHHNVTAPIFVDNSEAVNKFTSTESQLILLTVIPEEPTEAIARENHRKIYESRGILLTKKYK